MWRSQRSFKTYDCISENSKLLPLAKIQRLLWRTFLPNAKTLQRYHQHFYFQNTTGKVYRIRWQIGKNDGNVWIPSEYVEWKKELGVLQVIFKSSGGKVICFAANEHPNLLKIMRTIVLGRKTYIHQCTSTYLLRLVANKCTS